MLKNDRVNLVIALIIAFALWAYVIGEVNPPQTKTLRNIPITYVSQGELTDEGLVLLSVSDETISVTISGERKYTKDVDVSDIKAVVDVGGLSEGEHTVKINITVPDSVEFNEASKQKVTVAIDQLVTAEKPVAATLSGNISDESEPYIVQVSPETIEVTGAKTLVDSVVKLNAALDTDRVEDTMRALNVTPVPVDKTGNPVEGVTLSEKNVSITAVLLNKKTVRLEVPVVGENIGDAERTVTVPKSITIKGTADALAGISYITAETLNVSDIYEDTAVDVVPILPDGVELAAISQNLSAQVTVKGVEQKEFNYGLDSIVVEGVTEDLVATLEDVNIRLTVTGRESVIADVTADDFYFVADVDGLEPGTHTVTITCRYEKTVSEVSFTPKEVTVTLEKKPGNGDEPEDEGEAEE